MPRELEYGRPFLPRRLHAARKTGVLTGASTLEFKEMGVFGPMARGVAPAYLV
jgi:hypothetical protein